MSVQVQRGTASTVTSVDRALLGARFYYVSAARRVVVELVHVRYECYPMNEVVGFYSASRTYDSVKARFTSHCHQSETSLAKWLRGLVYGQDELTFMESMDQIVYPSILMGCHPYER